MGVVETVMDLTELKKAEMRMYKVTRRLGEMDHFDNFIGKNYAIHKVFAANKVAAASESTVLIQGDSGAGKELVAGAIHFNSNRAEKLLVAVNRSALSESLLESELFGYVESAFTGAIRNRVGRFEEANGGTIFLYEIGEISPLIQVKPLLNTSTAKINAFLGSCWLTT